MVTPGMGVKVSGAFSAAEKAPDTLRPTHRSVAPRAVSQQERDKIMQNPLVRQVVDIFDARLIDIRPAQEPQDKPTAPSKPDNPEDT